MTHYRAQYDFRRGASVHSSWTRDIDTLNDLAWQTARHEDVLRVRIWERKDPRSTWILWDHITHRLAVSILGELHTFPQPDRDDEDADDAEMRQHVHMVG